MLEKSEASLSKICIMMVIRIEDGLGIASGIVRGQKGDASVLARP